MQMLPITEIYAMSVLGQSDVLSVCLTKTLYHVLPVRTYDCKGPTVLILMPSDLNR